MPTIRDLVEALRQREGVEAAVVLGRDGLLIDGQTVQGLDADDIAARIPPIIGPADELGAALGRGALTTAVLEHQDGGMAIVAAMSSEALLLVLLRADANVGTLLYELRRNREHLAALA